MATPSRSPRAWPPPRRCSTSCRSARCWRWATTATRASRGWPPPGPRRAAGNVERIGVTDTPRWLEAAAARGPHLARVPVEPAPRGRRPPRHLRRAAQVRFAGRGRQHVRHPARAASARTGRRPRRCTPRRSTSAGTPTCCSAQSSRDARAHRAAARAPRHWPAPRPARLRPTSPCAASAHSRCVWSARRPTARARVIAERLGGTHGRRPSVRYPGFGGVISFDVRGGADPADAVCRAVQIIRHATSLGGVESTMERRAVIPGQTHLPPGLLRLSIGCEHPADLWRDLEQALAG